MTDDQPARIRASVSMTDLLLRYGHNLKKAGNAYTACCIAHDDTNPSMSIYRAEDGGERCHCHACGFHEDVIGVYMHLTNTDFREALDDLDDGQHKPSGKPYAIIENDAKPDRPERETFPPPPGAPEPRWFLENLGGDPVAVWRYTTPEGALWYYEARYEVEVTDKETGEIKIKKEPRCWTWGKRGAQPARWECGFPQKPRPLYGLHELAVASQVLVTEGPRKAEAARKMLNGTSAVACVGWPGGANGIRNADWSVLEGKPLILLPDADAPGVAAMEAIAERMIGKVPSIHIICTDELPRGWDTADAVAEGWDKAGFLEFLRERKVEWSPREPVEVAEPDIPEPPPMDEPPIEAYADDTHHIEAFHHGTTEQVWTTDPVDLFTEFVVPPLQRGLLPKVIEDHVFDIAEVINTDPAFGALTAVATVAGLIDDRIKIKLNHGYHESARLWAICCGEPSTKKSPIMDAIRQPLQKIKKRYAQEEAKINQRQSILDARHKAKLKEYTDACIKSDDHGMVEPMPCEQLQRRRIECDNLTREAFEEVLRNMPSGLIIHADELSAWIGGMDAYKAGGVKADRALWLRAYNGGPMQVDKVQRGSYLIENWSATITGGIQPSKLAAMAPHLDDDGLLQRFLIVSSSRDGGQGLARAWDHHAAEAWRNLLEHIVEIKPGGGQVELSPEAASIRNAAVKRIYEIINSKMIGRAFTTALGKWEGTTGRMILIFHCVECASTGRHPEAVPVSAETAQLAVDYLMRHLLPHMVSFYEDGLGQSPAHDCAKIIAGRIIALEQAELKIRELQTSGPRKWRNASEEVQRQTLARLVEYGWIQPADVGANITRRPSRYHVNPHVHTVYEQHRAAEIARIEAAREIAARIKEGGRGK